MPGRRHIVAIRGVVALFAACSIIQTPSLACADVDLEFRADSSVVVVGETIDVQLFAVSDTAEDQLFSAVQAIFVWDPSVLTLVETSSDGAVPLLVNDVPTNASFGLNEMIPPADGDGFLLCLANLGQRATATPIGTLLHTFSFQAIASAPATDVGLVLKGGTGGRTLVVSGTVPGLDISGRFIPASIAVTGACPADLDGSGNVGFNDLVQLQSAWGPCSDCPADLAPDGVVDFEDLVQLLAAWGPC